MSGQPLPKASDILFSNVTRQEHHTVISSKNGLDSNGQSCSNSTCSPNGDTCCLNNQIESKIQGNSEVIKKFNDCTMKSEEGTENEPKKRARRRKNPQLTIQFKEINKSKEVINHPFLSIPTSTGQIKNNKHRSHSRFNSVNYFKNSELFEKQVVANIPEKFYPTNITSPFPGFSYNIDGTMLKSTNDSENLPQTLKTTNVKLEDVGDNQL